MVFLWFFMFKWLNSAGDWGKSISTMKLGEQMVFFNEKCWLVFCFYKRWRIGTRKSSKDVFDSIVVTLWFIVDNIGFKVTSLSVLFIICWHVMFTWQPMQVLLKSAASFFAYLLQVCTSEKMLHHCKLFMLWKQFHFWILTDFSYRGYSALCFYCWSGGWYCHRAHPPRACVATTAIGLLRYPLEPPNPFTWLNAFV